MRREREKARERGANADAGETMAVCVTISWLPYRCRVRRSRLFRISSSFSLLLCLVSYSQLLTSRNFVSICCRMRERKRARGYKEERHRWLAEDPEVDRKDPRRCISRGEIDVWCKKKNRKKQPACFPERGSAMERERRNEEAKNRNGPARQLACPDGLSSLSLAQRVGKLFVTLLSLRVTVYSSESPTYNYPKREEARYSD